MLNRAILVFMLLVMIPVTLQARFGDTSETQVAQNLQKKSLRVLVEGDQQTLSYAIEDMRKLGNEFGLEIDFASATEAYDARIIFAAGTGMQWNPDPHPTFHTINFAYSSAVVLTPDGKLLFTVSGSGSTIRNARVATIKDAIKKLHLDYDALKQKASEAPAGQTSAEDRAGDPQIAGLSDQPGVYSKAQAGWIRLNPVAASTTKSRGTAKAMFSWGLASMSAAQVYQGAQAMMQTAERKPVFFVRDFAVSSQSAIIVRVEKKSDSREIQVGTVSAFGARPGLREQDRRGVKVSRAAGGVSIITPVSELEPGEYLLLLDGNESDQGYDFGIKSAKP